MMEKLRIIFMGTPEFAVSILDSILKKNYDVVAVITAADKPAGRGQKIKFSAVKEYALENNLNVLQPPNLKDPSFLDTLKDLNANLQIVVAFRMLPEAVWKMPKYGTFNLHASILPNYRGAAPINWAIINGETETGVTTFFIDEKIDTGAIILSETIKIENSENAGTLHDKLIALGAKVVLKTLELIETERVKTTIQTTTEEIKTAYKLNKENCKIDFLKPATEIFNLIRGLYPYPSAWCMIKNSQQEWIVKIHQASLELEAHNLKIGTIITTKKEFRIAVLNGFLKIEKIQFPGKKAMSASELLNGINLTDDSMAC